MILEIDQPGPYIRCDGCNRSIHTVAIHPREHIMWMLMDMARDREWEVGRNLPSNTREYMSVRMKDLCPKCK